MTFLTKQKPTAEDIHTLAMAKSARIDAAKLRREQAARDAMTAMLTSPARAEYLERLIQAFDQAMLDMPAVGFCLGRPREYSDFRDRVFMDAALNWRLVDKYDLLPGLQADLERRGYHVRYRPFELALCFDAPINRQFLEDENGHIWNGHFMVSTIPFEGVSAVPERGWCVWGKTFLDAMLGRR